MEKLPMSIEDHTRYKEILLLLFQQNDYKRSEDIASELGVSLRTIKDDLSKIRPELEKIGIRLFAKKSKGYQLEIVDDEKFEPYRELIMMYGIADVLNVKGERVYHILRRMIFSEEYTTLDILKEELHVERSVIVSDMKTVKEYLKNYNLTIGSRPHYGMKIEGKEFYRLFAGVGLYQYFSPLSKPTFTSKEFTYFFTHTTLQEKEVRQKIMKIFIEQNVTLADSYMERFFQFLILVVNWEKNGKSIEDIGKKIDIQCTREWKCILNICSYLTETFGIPFTGYAKNILTFEALISVDLYRYVDCSEECYGEIYIYAENLREQIMAILDNQLGIKTEKNTTFYKDTLKWAIPIATKILLKIEDDIDAAIYTKINFFEENRLLSSIVDTVSESILETYSYALSRRERSILFGLMLNMYGAIELPYEKMQIAIIAFDGRLAMQRLKFYMNRHFSPYIKKLSSKVIYELDENQEQFDYYISSEFGKKFNIQQTPIAFVQETLDENEYLLLLKKVFITGYGFEKSLPKIECISLKKSVTHFDLNITEKQWIDTTYVLLNKQETIRLYYNFKSLNKEKFIICQENTSKETTYTIYLEMDIHNNADLIKMIFIVLETFSENEEARKMLFATNNPNYNFLTLSNLLR